MDASVIIIATETIVILFALLLVAILTIKLTRINNRLKAESVSHFQSLAQVNIPHLKQDTDINKEIVNISADSTSNGEVDKTINKKGTEEEK